jgi:hypothetical protein
VWNAWQWDGYLQEVIPVFLNLVDQAESPLRMIKGGGISDWDFLIQAVRGWT